MTVMGSVKTIEAMEAHLASIKSFVLSLGQINLTEGLIEGSGFEAGLSGNDQIHIALRTMARSRRKYIPIQNIYDAIEKVMNLKGWTLSFNGKAAVRAFVNGNAVNNGLVFPYDHQSNLGWQITAKGRQVIKNA